jgi:glycosyltransferase involved in cell wall biosynthesis
MPPKFSIVIPTFNSKAYVEECVASAIKQTATSFEVVIDDNDSQDGSVDLLKKNFANDEKFKLFENKEDLNIPLGWSRAMAHASGDYKLLLHSDNLIHPQFLEAIEIILKKFPADVIYTECHYFEGETPPGLFAPLDLARELPVTFLTAGPRAVDYVFRFQRMIPTSCLLIANQCFKDRPPYLPKFRWDPDIEQMTWLAEHFNVLHLNVPLVAIRTHPGQAPSWRDPSFLGQYRELLEMAQRHGNSEKHHLLTHWAYSNQDVCDRLKDLKKASFGYYHAYLWAWLNAELELLGYFSLNFARKIKLMAAFTVGWWKARRT